MRGRSLSVDQNVRESIVKWAILVQNGLYQRYSTNFNPTYATGFFPPENIRKPAGFLMFMGVQKETSGMKWVLKIAN